MLKFFKWVALFGLLILSLCICGLSGSGYSPWLWLFAPRQTIKVLVPVGYEGPILIAYQIPDGERAEKQGDVLLYRISSDGTLLLKDDPPSSVIAMSFWYLEANGDLQLIPQSACWDDSPEKSVVVCTGMMTLTHNRKDLHPNITFAVTSISDKWKHFDTGDQLIDRYLDRLAVSNK
jgi:hypothetical protein